MLNPCFLLTIQDPTGHGTLMREETGMTFLLVAAEHLEPQK